MTPLREAALDVLVSVLSNSIGKAYIRVSSRDLDTIDAALDKLRAVLAKAETTQDPAKQWTRCDNVDHLRQQCTLPRNHAGRHSRISEVANHPAPELTPIANEQIFALQHNPDLATLEKLAEEFGNLRLDYSGRDMFGATCVGIVASRPLELIEEAAARGIRGARIDDMGRNSIVYWPSIRNQD